MIAKIDKGNLAIIELFKSCLKCHENVKFFKTCLKCHDSAKTFKTCLKGHDSDDVSEKLVCKVTILPMKEFPR